MIRYKYRYYLLLLLLVLCGSVHAQWASHQSVLAEHEWYKIGVTDDGVYGIDYATLQSWGVDVQQLNPAKIRLFGNVQWPLPESNDSLRYDDLSEAAILVTGSDDGFFDEGDRIMFYGQGPVNMVSAAGSYYSYNRNPYTDTVYYYLCVNGDSEGLRIEEQSSVITSETDPKINTFLDYYYHESEEISPYASGRNWYGDLFTGQDGFKEFDVEIPGLVLDGGVRVESRVLCRCNPSISYNVKVNGVGLVVNQRIDAYKPRIYGREHQFNKLAHPTSNNIALRYEFEPFEGNPMMFIDYFVLNFWRELRFSGRNLAFRIVPSQLVLLPARVVVSDATASTICWDITDPIHPFKQLTDAQSNGVFFGIDGRTERRYCMFEPEGVKQVASCQRIANQNLHGIETAEMLIITPRVFWTQAQDLADFHAQHDGMDCVLADVAEIYNEFGTGIPDPTSLRDFIRMVYLRSNGDLKYVLLLGKGTHDYRCIGGVDNCFVPTYETAEKEYSEVESMCTDDYFALMDVNEGENSNGKVDLGVGRIPITTPEQGDRVVDKIKHYADPDASHGLWKNNHLLMADNDNWYYPNYTEGLALVLDTAWHDATVKKLYMDSYPVVNTPSGTRSPMAHQTLMDYFDSGIGVLSYTGHGGTKSLSAEWVLACPDIQAMANYDKLPFVHTATCEFSKFDEPTVVSGGELMLLNPSGGAIALLTTVRPTIAANNQKLSLSVHEHLYDRIGNEPLRFGDIYRIAKSDTKNYTKPNIVYVLFGDPALRLNTPSYRIQTEQVQGAETLTVTGYVALPEGTIDAQFNGVLDLRLYDQMSKYTSLGLYDNAITYSYFNDVLFDGRVSVVDGRFEAQVPLPSNVSQGTGKARLVYSAYDSIRKVEAGGACDDFRVQAPTTVVDNQGPDIKLYWNTPDFESGNIGAPNGVLYADLFDEHGIYHYNVSIGRDIVMNSNIAEFDNLILNNHYEPSIDDFRRGRISLPLNELDNGVYEFSLKAWDTWNNSSEASIVLLVERSVFIAEVHSFPNPFADEVYFSFVNGEQSEELEVKLEVFDVMGRCVAQLQQQTASVSGVVPPICWDGKSSTGSDLDPGMYLYKLSITGSTGKTKTIAHPMIKK